MKSLPLKLGRIFFFFFLLCCSLFFAACDEGQKEKAQGSVGVWWWDNRLGEEYLDFAYQNKVNEIYYYTSSFSQRHAEFIEKAANYDMKVYLLCGDYTWIEDMSKFDALMEQYQDFQNNTEQAFAGVHIDVEPHQHPDWEENQQELTTKYIKFVKTAVEKYQGVNFDFDIPFWLEEQVSFEGQTKAAFKFVLDYADRVFVMSYRDSAEAMFDVAQEELAYANEIGKPIFLSAETGQEEDVVTYFEEGKAYLNSQLEKLKEMVGDQLNIAIHHIKSWKALQD